jgi:hypothetical protein
LPTEPRLASLTLPCNAFPFLLEGEQESVLLCFTDLHDVFELFCDVSCLSPKNAAGACLVRRAPARMGVVWDALAAILPSRKYACGW